jgi:hypothetical protein
MDHLHPIPDRQPNILPLSPQHSTIIVQPIPAMLHHHLPRANDKMLHDRVLQVVFKRIHIMHQNN